MTRLPSLLCLALLLPGLAAAQGFATANHATLSRVALLPVMTGEAMAVPGSETRYTLDWNNESVAHDNGREQLLIDAEALRLALHHRRSFGEGWQVSAELPLLFTGGGVMDGPIETWHGWFGLPNGNRDQRPQNRYRVLYQRDDVRHIDESKGESGLGDVRLGLSRALSSRWRLHSSLQLPTGSRADLTGGHAGAALWLAHRAPLGGEGFVLDLAAGASATDRGGPLSDQQKAVVWLGSAALTAPLPLISRLQAVVQLNGHSAPYRDSTLAPLGSALQLAFGLRRGWEGGAVELAFLEDLKVNASPDFGLHLSLRVYR